MGSRISASVGMGPADSSARLSSHMQEGDEVLAVWTTMYRRHYAWSTATVAHPAATLGGPQDLNAIIKNILQVTVHAARRLDMP